MANILDQITAQKRLEINELYRLHSLDALKKTVQPTLRRFYGEIAAARQQQTPFFICEFKRKSPSEGWINEHANLPAQIIGYANAGARAISVLTDTLFFGGTYADLELAAATLANDPNRPLLLQKDFVLDDIQIYLARQAGADLILLIAAILSPERLQSLRLVAESLGMGVLVEVHDEAELTAVEHLDFPVLGINNRDLKTFRTALNRVNVLKYKSPQRFIIAESGIQSYRDFAVVRQADGFLIGTGLMRQGAAALSQLDPKRPLFKACGIRTADLFQTDTADWIGINFSPVSKRRMPLDILDHHPLPPNAVALFYQNSEAEINDILRKYPFQRVQVYAGDVTPALVRSLRQKVLMAARIRTTQDLLNLEDYAADIDFFILDGSVPGSGIPIDATLIPRDFKYPFLLAGGLKGDEDLTLYQNCFGVDIASGIETDGVVDHHKIATIRNRLRTIPVK